MSKSVLVRAAVRGVPVSCIAALIACRREGLLEELGGMNRLTACAGRP